MYFDMDYIFQKKRDDILKYLIDIDITYSE